MVAAALAFMAALAVRSAGSGYVLLSLEEWPEGQEGPPPDPWSEALLYSPTAGEIELPPGAPRPRAGDRVLLWRPGLQGGRSLRWVRPLPWGRALGGHPPVRLLAVQRDGAVSLAWREERFWLNPGEAWGVRVTDGGSTRVLRVTHRGRYATIRLAGGG